MRHIFLLTLVCLISTPLFAAELYFPHIASDGTWETEVGIINTGDTALSGTLYAYNDSGSLVESKPISLAAGARSELTVDAGFQRSMP